MPFLSRTAAARGEARALVSPDGTISYAQLERASEKVARQLVTLGVRPGDVVALKGHPDAGTNTAIHGIWKAGAILAPVNPKWTAEEEGRALEMLDPGVVLAGSGMVMDAGSQGDRRWYSLGCDADAGGMERLGSLWPDTGPLSSQSDPDAWNARAAATLLTSGTSGSPNLVTLSFGNLRASAEASRERLELSPEDRWSASLSISHVGGLALVSRSAHLGSCLVLNGPFQAREFASLVAEGVLTHASLVPTMLHQFLEAWGEAPSPDTLGCLLIGGGPAEGSLVQRGLELGFPLALTYGLTEASSQVATAPPSLVREKPGTVGDPLPGVEVKLTELGEILVRGPTVAGGGEGVDGWLRTGDLARRDDDGHLWVTGRISHRIISGGVNVDPAEVEAVIRTHPRVTEVAVVGIPDPKWGEKVAAAVVPSAGGSVKAGELERLARAALSPAKRPRFIRLVDDLPRNPNGKVDRRKVQAFFS